LADGPIDDLMYSNSASVILRSACGISATMYHHAAHHTSAKIPEIILHLFSFSASTKILGITFSESHVSVNKMNTKKI
jgi:hypothetical protein